jgi:hypothetical protein
MKQLLILIFCLGICLYAQQNETVQSAFVSNNAGIEDEQDPPEDLKVDKMPTPIQSKYPAYPFTARQAGLNGMVWLKLLVGEDGIVKKSIVTKATFMQKDIAVNLDDASSTIKLAADSITLACVKTAGQWKFSPAILNEKPVKVWVVLPFKFKLDAPHKEEKK